MADDPFGLDLGADHEAGHVLDEHQRDPERVAEVHETGGLVGRVVVEDPAELLRLVRDDPGGTPAEAREAGDDRLRPLALHVEELAVVDDAADHLIHVIGLAVGVRQHVEQLLLATVDRVRDGPDRGALFAVLRHEREVLLDPLDALLVVGDFHVPHAGLAAVHARAAEFLLGDVLADGRPDQVRAGERHRAAALDHRHEVGEARDVGGSCGARPHQGGDERDDPAHDHLFAEQVTGAREQRAGGLLHARPGRVEQPDERHALGQRELAQARGLQLAGHAHRARHHGEVVGTDRDHAPVDLAVAGDDAVRGRVDVVHRAL